MIETGGVVPEIAALAIQQEKDYKSVVPLLGKKPDLKIITIVPSHYDHNDNLRQYSRTAMFPPVFSTLDGISTEAAKNFGMKISFAHYNERTEDGDGYVNEIIGDNSAQEKVVFISVKTFEIPRALDIARKIKRAIEKLKEREIPIVFGGPGISLADWKTYNLLVDEGISFNVGEAEVTAPKIIYDVKSHKLKPVYWQETFVNLRTAPLPLFPDKREYEKSVINLVGIDTSEGCPFNCHYCCERELRGDNKSPDRSREIEGVIEWVRWVHKLGYRIMYTDDNFRRSANYGEKRDALINLNEELDYKIWSYSQMDVSKDLVGDVRDLALMGIRQSFCGLETDDEETLKAEGKGQNKPEDYKALADEFRKNGLCFSSGIMVGFPNQTPESIHKEMKDFSKIIDLGYLFAVTPLPGTLDYKDAIEKKQIKSFDPNLYDSMHFVRDWFENMTFEDAKKAYHQAFFDFYSIRHILTGHPQRHFFARNVIASSYNRALAEYGKRRHGRPFHFMLDAFFAKNSGVKRPEDSFRGFELTSEDLAKKTEYLEKLTAA